MGKSALLFVEIICIKLQDPIFGIGARKTLILLWFICLFTG